MNRTLLAVCAVLAALCAVQWSTLRRLKGDLAVVNYAAAARDFDSRREEIDRVIAWLDTDARNGDAAGLSARPRPICTAGTTNVSGAEDMLFDMYLYLRARTAGVSETDSRQRVVDGRAQRVRDH
jgi:hypothetical protein